MSEWITPEQEVWVIQRYNRYIREHMAKVAELLGMEQRPSSTWDRHSFATNLNNSGWYRTSTSAIAWDTAAMRILLPTTLVPILWIRCWNITGTY